MSKSDKLTNLCSHILSRAARGSGRVVKKDLVTSAATQISRAGGPKSFGVGPAWEMMILQRILMDEFTSQMRAPMSAAMTKVMRGKIPPGQEALLEGATTWLAQDLGVRAVHVFAITATSEEWIINGGLKGKISSVVQKEADRSINIGRYLKAHGFDSIEEMLT